LMYEPRVDDVAIDTSFTLDMGVYKFGGAVWVHGGSIENKRALLLRGRIIQLRAGDLLIWNPYTKRFFQDLQYLIK